MLTYIVERLGRSQRMLLAQFVAQITAGQADGSIRAGNPAELATMVLLITQSARSPPAWSRPNCRSSGCTTSSAWRCTEYPRPDPHGEPA